MADTTNLFHHKYNKIISKLVQEELSNFKAIDNEEDRIKLLYPRLGTIGIDILNSGKNYAQALNSKQCGNKFYLNKDNWKAIESYNKGILSCPQNSPEERETLSILIANRSACFFDVKRYESALNDIDYALSINAYPQKLHYKLYIRKAKCHIYFRKETDLALNSYQTALKLLEYAHLNEEDLKLRKKEILSGIDTLRTLKKHVSIKRPLPQKSFAKSNPKYKYANELVDFNCEPGLGRFAVATKDIGVGTVVIDEPPHCVVLIKDYFLTNCQYCMLSTDAPVACNSCSYVAFCSLKCMQKALSYHRFECGFLKTFVESGVSINCHMALRIITQQSLGLFKILPNEINSIYSLCRNEQQRKVEDHFHYTIMAIYLLRLLKTSSYFETNCKDSVLTEEEALITKLIIKHLEILEFNAHEVSELHEAEGDVSGTSKAIYIGGGLYPTAALFNHSCDPGVIRYNIGSRVILKTIRPIKKGEAVYENYGPIYTSMVREERRSFLQNRYWFTCACQACTEDWPLFKSMRNDKVMVRCRSKDCNGGVYVQDSFIESTCSRCNATYATINVLPHLKALSELEHILPKAEICYTEKKYDDALKLYIKAMNIYHKHTVPPFPDWVKVQQRLRTCMVSEGNKSIEYSKKHLK